MWSAVSVEKGDATLYKIKIPPAIPLIFWCNADAINKQWCASSGNEIVRRFDAPRATFYADVEATVNQLSAEGANNLEPVNA